jgi:Fe-S-cluster containining protein
MASNSVHNSSPMTWEKALGIPKPGNCNLRAACCCVATPSVPVSELVARAAAGDATSRDFLSVFIPHTSHQAAREFYPEQPDHIDRVLSMVRHQSTRATLNEADVVFYHCRNLNEHRQCQVYEDRPTFCRDYPASPLSILVKGCGYQDWATQCKEKLKHLGYEAVETP